IATSASANQPMQWPPTSAPIARPIPIRTIARQPPHPKQLRARASRRLFVLAFAVEFLSPPSYAPPTHSWGNGNMADIEVPVLIVGGSLVGMSAAMLLGHHGIRPLVVEHHRGTAIHPRAAMITQRTMEILRTVGIEQIV